MQAEDVERSDFLITRYVKQLGKWGLSPLRASIIFGGVILVIVFIAAVVYGTGSKFYPMGIGYVICLLWLWLAPYLIFTMRASIDNLRASLISALGEAGVKKIDRLQSDFHSMRHLLVGAPLMVVVSVWVLCDHRPILPILLIWLGSWLILAYLAGIVIWGVCIVTWTVVRLSESDMNLNPMEEIGLVGPKSLASLSLKSMMTLASGALMIPMMQELLYQSAPVMHVALLTVTAGVVFACLVLLSFAVPVYVLFSAAERVRQPILRDLRGKYSEMYRLFELAPEDTNIGVRVIALAQALHRMECIPTLPWSLDTSVKVIGSVLCSIVAGVISAVCLPPPLP